MKVIHVTDLHGNFAGLEATVDLAVSSGPCILAISGDMVEWPMRRLENDEWTPYLDAIFKAGERLAASAGTMVLCSGNHDSWAAPGEVPWFAKLRLGFVGDALQPARASHVVEVGDETAVVTCFPWRNDGGRFSRPGMLDFAEAGRILREASAPAGAPWIWLHHAAPFGTPVAAGALDEGERLLMETAAAYEPTLVLCGHIHGSPWHAKGAPYWMDPRSGALFSNPGRSKTGLCVSTFEIGQNGKSPVCDWRTISC